MTKRPYHATARDFPRTARLNHLLQEIVADEVSKLDDERLGLLTIVAVQVEPGLRHATVWYSSIADDADGPGDTAEGDDSDQIAEALEEHRPRLQSAVARQSRLKRTPALAFRRDEVTRSAERVERVLRELHRDES